MVDKKSPFVPEWFKLLFSDSSTTYVTRALIFTCAEEAYGEMTFSERSYLNEYLDDLAESGLIYQRGNFVYVDREKWAA